MAKNGFLFEEEDREKALNLRVRLELLPPYFVDFHHFLGKYSIQGLRYCWKIAQSSLQFVWPLLISQLTSSLPVATLVPSSYDQNLWKGGKGERERGKMGKWGRRKENEKWSY